MANTAIECRATQEDLLNLVPDNAPGQGQPSPAQHQLMVKLTKELRDLDPVTADQALDYMLRMVGRWTPERGGNASRWIDRLIAKTHELRTAPVQIEDGMYQLDGTIYKVQHAVHGSGNQYAKRLVPPVAEGHRATFDYAPGMIRQLHPEHRMTVEQAKQYGALYGTCCQCGAVLTNEDSIEAGIGPVCAGKI